MKAVLTGVLFGWKYFNQFNESGALDEQHQIHIKQYLWRVFIDPGIDINARLGADPVRICDLFELFTI